MKGDEHGRAVACLDKDLSGLLREAAELAAILAGCFREDRPHSFQGVSCSLKAIRDRSAALAGPASSTLGQKSLARMAAIADWVLERWKGKLPGEVLGQ